MVHEMDGIVHRNAEGHGNHHHGHHVHAEGACAHDAANHKDGCHVGDHADKTSFYAHEGGNQKQRNYYEGDADGFDFTFHQFVVHGGLFYGVTFYANICLGEILADQSLCAIDIDVHLLGIPFLQFHVNVGHAEIIGNAAYQRSARYATQGSWQAAAGLRTGARPRHGRGLHCHVR